MDKKGRGDEKMNYYLAVDIGASSGRHIIGWMENGVIRLEEIYRFPNLPDKVGGHLQWDVERLFQEVVNGLKRAKEMGKIPVSVAIDTWAVDYALLDRDKKAIGGVYCYRDDRTKQAIASVHEKMPFEELYRRTGIQFQPFNTIYQLYADKLSGRLDRAAYFLMLPDYLHFLLTGKMAQEYTNATSTGMVNAVTHTWDGEILSVLGFEKGLFRSLSQPTEVIGPLKEEIAEMIGYQTAVVLPATHDTASAVLAAPIDENLPYISSGTWSLFGLETDRAKTDEGSRRFNYSNEGSLDFKFRYQKNIMGLWMIQQVRHELDDRYTFAELEAMARECPIDEIVDVGDNRFLAPESMIGEIASAVGRKLSVGELAYCIFHSLAIGYGKALAEMAESTGKTFTAIDVIGGGCKNLLLDELTAKYAGVNVLTGPVEATAIGNLLVQMMAGGEIATVAEGRNIVKNSFGIKEISL